MRSEDCSEYDCIGRLLSVLVPAFVQVPYGTAWGGRFAAVWYRTGACFGAGTIYIAIQFSLRKGGSSFVSAVVLYVWYGEIVCDRIHSEVCVSGVYCLSSRVFVWSQ